MTCHSKLQGAARTCMLLLWPVAHSDQSCSVDYTGSFLKRSVWSVLLQNLRCAARAERLESQWAKFVALSSEHGIIVIKAVQSGCQVDEQELRYSWIRPRWSSIVHTMKLVTKCPFLESSNSSLVNYMIMWPASITSLQRSANAARSIQAKDM